MEVNSNPKRESVSQEADFCCNETVTGSTCLLCSARAIISSMKLSRRIDIESNIFREDGLLPGEKMYVHR